jgi:hypothetical protein
MKYVVIEKRGIESPIIFPEWMRHGDVLKEYDTAVSAGFCSFSGSLREDGSAGLTVYCWGHSVSLKVKSRGSTDADLIQKMNEFRG